MMDFYALELVESEEDGPIISLEKTHIEDSEKGRAGKFPIPNSNSIQFNSRGRPVKSAFALCFLEVRCDAQQDMQSDNTAISPLSFGFLRLELILNLLLGTD